MAGWRGLGAIALGGGLGSCARHLAGEAVGGGPWGTFTVNVTGCLVMGVLMVYILEVWPPRRYVRPFAAIGFLGGYTTFSAYSAEIRDLLDRHAWALAAVYALGSMLAALCAVWLGVAAARFAAVRHRGARR